MQKAISAVKLVLMVIFFLSPPEGGLDLVTNRKVAICHRGVSMYLCI